MAKIGLFYGTQTGNPETIAEIIQQELEGESVVDLLVAKRLGRLL